MKVNSDLGAVILGAGLSSRMGRPKLLLPWRNATVIQTIISTLRISGVDTIVLVSGASHDQLTQLLQGDRVKIVHNPDYANGSMIDSLKVGLRELSHQEIHRCLLALGDHPQMEEQVIDAIRIAAEEHPDQIIIPSYNMRRGHPWVIPEQLWSEIMMLQSEHTMRDLIRNHTDKIHYVNTDTAKILADLDTPEDYNRENPL